MRLNLKVNDVDRKAHAAWMQVINPTDKDGRPSGRPRPVHLMFDIEAAEAADIEPFSSAVNANGQFNWITAEYTVLDPQAATAYRIIVEKAYVKSWKLVRPAERGRADIERVELFAGRVTVHAGGKTATYEVRDFGP